jgi:hypothetical protein
LVAKDQDLSLTVSRLTPRSQSEDEAENHIKEGEHHRRILGTVRRRMNRVLVPLRTCRDTTQRNDLTRQGDYFRRIADGKIVELGSAVDSAALLGQLGVIQLPPRGLLRFIKHEVHQKTLIDGTS